MSTSPYAPLPTPHVHAPRKVGVEVEFSGMTEVEAARVATDTLGGTAREDGPHHVTVEGSSIGRLRFVLDTKFRDKAHDAISKAGLDVARAVVPIELVTDPLTPDQMADLDRLVEALRKAGAKGTNEGALLGFGLHLNPEVRGLQCEDLVPTLTAYGLLEDWIRQKNALNGTRQMLPFIDPYPPEFVDALVMRGGWSVELILNTYLTHNATRNHGLDALPILATIDSGAVAKALGTDHSVAARPAWHYRLPDARIGDEGWTPAGAWADWQRVETLADDGETMALLKNEWRKHRARIAPTRSGWAETVERILSDEPTRTAA